MRKAVIFDLDGVITDTARYHFLAWKRLADQEGIFIDEQFNETLKGVSRMQSLELILAKGKKEYTDKQKLALAEEKNEYYKKLIKSITKADLLPGAFSTLSELQAMQIKIGLASASKNAPAIVEKLGISRFFDNIVDANHVTHGKPDPEVFLTGASNLQVRPEECIGVEDAVVGVQAIKAAHMYAIGIGNPKILHQADLVITDLTSFPLGEAYKAIA